MYRADYINPGHKNAYLNAHPQILRHVVGHVLLGHRIVRKINRGGAVEGSRATTP